MTPQCSRSVIGLMLSLSHLLTRMRSFQAFEVSATSRPLFGAAAQPAECCEKNSIQPIGARVLPDSETKRARSPATLGAQIAATRTIAAMAAYPLFSIPVEYRFMG